MMPLISSYVHKLEVNGRRVLLLLLFYSDSLNSLLCNYRILQTIATPLANATFSYSIKVTLVKHIRTVQLQEVWLAIQVPRWCHRFAYSFSMDVRTKQV